MLLSLSRDFMDLDWIHDTSLDSKQQMGNTNKWTIRVENQIFVSSHNIEATSATSLNELAISHTCCRHQHLSNGCCRTDSFHDQPPRNAPQVGGVPTVERWVMYHWSSKLMNHQQQPTRIEQQTTLIVSNTHTHIE